MAAAGLLDASLQAHQHGTGRASLHREGLLAMSRMTEGVRRCTFLLVPNAHTVRRDLLVFSGLTNDDKDHYFDDALFPRIDEDLSWDMNADGKKEEVGGAIYMSISSLECMSMIVDACLCLLAS